MFLKFAQLYITQMFNVYYKLFNTCVQQGRLLAGVRWCGAVLQCLDDVPAVAHAVDRTSVHVMCKCVRALFHVCDLAELALAGCMRELAPDGRARVVAPARSI